MSRPIVILGGSGVFGTRLSQALAKDATLSVIVAGRSRQKAQTTCAGTRATPLALNREAADLPAQLAALRPFAVIDAAGPFQAYGNDPYRLARAALAAGAHYLDLSDDAGFTAGITALDTTARAANLTALSGVSSVPALSSAVVTELAEGFDDIHLIDSVILPGNRAPRGLSVIRAILAQAGRPVQHWRGGRAVAYPGWSAAQPITLHNAAQSLPARPASLIGAPDLQLFPAHFKARSVSFRAGLELGLMHHGLAALAWLPRLGLARSLASLARPLLWAANLLRPFGTDRGGMRVRVAGLAQGQPIARDWVLIAGAGDGPEIPAIPARVAVQMLLSGTLSPGARPCLGDLPLTQLEDALHAYAITTTRTETSFPILFQSVLGADFASLPKPLQELHNVIDLRRWQGQARVTRGTGRMSRLICWMFRFPAATDTTPVEVTMDRSGSAERWTRRFGPSTFLSTLRARNGKMTERFGPFTFTLGLAVTGESLIFPVTSGRMGPIPLPRAILPRSDAVETVEDTPEGPRARFDVALSLPLVGPLVRYQGWLEPADQSRKNRLSLI